MNADMYEKSFGSIILSPGWPLHVGIQSLPTAQTRWTQQEFGTILFQEILTDKYVLRYFIFRFLKEMTLVIKEQGEGFQSLLSLKGGLRHGIKGQRIHTINEGQFTLLDAGRLQTQSIITGGRE